MVLGSQLRDLRESRGITREDAGYVIRASGSKISRLELGRVGFKERDVADLLTHYGVTDPEEREKFLDLTRNANARGWWQRYGDVMPGWFKGYVGLEASAALIRTYEVQYVPGLLQTEDYARAVIRLSQAGLSPEAIDQRVNLRMSRQKILNRPSPTRVWAVVDEAVLRRHIGGPGVMRAQIEYLITFTKQPNVTLQVLSIEAGGHGVAGGSFTILRFETEQLPDIVYLEQLNGSIFEDKREEVDRYLHAMETLSVHADQPSATAETLTRILTQFE